MSLFVFSDEVMDKLDDASKGQVDMPSWLAKVLDASTFKAWQRQQAAEQAVPEQMAPPPAEEKVLIRPSYVIPFIVCNLYVLISSEGEEDGHGRGTFF